MATAGIYYFLQFKLNANALIDSPLPHCSILVNTKSAEEACFRNLLRLWLSKYFMTTILIRRTLLDV